MAEWHSVFVVFWALWLADGVRFAPSEVFSVISSGRRGRAWVRHDRWHWPHAWPGGWRATVADIPWTISPVGIANRPAGTMGRPTEVPATVVAWRWEEIETVRQEKGWLLINGRRFCRDTGHVGASRVLAWAKAAPAVREEKIQRWIDACLRPAHLRRRRTVLLARTETVVALNTFFFALAVAITLYVAADFSVHLSKPWAALAGRALPWCVGYLAVLHVAAVIAAGRARRRLKAVRLDVRGTALFSALMLPPQALRLRALVGEPFFPAQHPLAFALAFGGKATVREEIFNTLADLRWPLVVEKEPALAREIASWFRGQLQRRIERALKNAGVSERELFEAPEADGAESCRYCPRCRSQFVTGHATCPRGVALQPVRRTRVEFG